MILKGPTWEGRSGVHTHMTNTRITDPEIMEIRYPVILNHFSLERGSGGVGQFPGGDGVRREILFRVPMTLSVLTERRVFRYYADLLQPMPCELQTFVTKPCKSDVCRPYGFNGGAAGRVGSNLLAKSFFQKNEQMIAAGADAGPAGQKTSEDQQEPHRDHKLINLGGKTSVDVEAGDLFVLLSPGGGGWGTSPT